LTPLPPVGSSPVAIAPPIATPSLDRQPDLVTSGAGRPAPSSNRGVRVVRFDEQIVTIGRPQQGQQPDSYRSLSVRFYGSDEYAQALQMFNAEHPMSRVARDGTLNPGDTVFIPDTHKLESTYGHLINVVGQERDRLRGGAPTPR
jgi:hypothetical protein